MENFEITSDLTIAGTKLSMDGKESTKKENVVAISMYASSPVKGDEYDSGWVNLSVTTVDDKGTVETKDYRKSEYLAKKIPMGKTMKDYLTKEGIDSVVRYIGREADQNKETIINKIMSKAEEDKLSCPDKEALLNRTVESLEDKASDMGIELKD